MTVALVDFCVVVFFTLHLHSYENMFPNPDVCL